MSDQDQTSSSCSRADGQTPQFTSTDYDPAQYTKRKRSADATLKDQEAVRDYLTFKQSKGLMTDSEKRLLDKIAAVCGIALGPKELNKRF